MSLSDPDVVRREYASEAGLRARASVYQGLAGQDARHVAFEAVAEAAPKRVLEVGCGWGAFSARVQHELGSEVIALDLSPRMVELARERGVDARMGDVQDLPFPDGSFDCAVANWMLYHVPDIDRGLEELARVLRSGGRLVAATNGRRHLEELWLLVGRDKSAESRHFFSEDGEEILERHFAHVSHVDVESRMTFETTAAVRGYVESSIAHKHLAEGVPELAEPLVATRRSTVFVAEKAP
ncbi:MAG TPA: class I SAM-dependent methyltransferase [Gaiellaceae bacterium]|nr:class I SAM-dependent methyltransferase [Gaiellaceae bacterium]